MLLNLRPMSGGFLRHSPLTLPSCHGRLWSQRIPGSCGCLLARAMLGLRLKSLCLIRITFDALLSLMRPFVLKKEATHFGRVVNILRWRLDHPAFRTYLDRQKTIFAGKRQQAMKLFSNGTVINSTETLDLWLNGFEYHRDAEKRTQFEALQGEALPVEVSLNLLVGIVLDRARAVLDIGNAIYAMRRNMAICPFPGDEVRRA